jgi:hypothetical protein
MSPAWTAALLVSVAIDPAWTAALLVSVAIDPAWAAALAVNVAILLVIPDASTVVAIPPTVVPL